MFRKNLIWIALSTLALILFGLNACADSSRAYPTNVFVPPTRLPTQPPPTASPTDLAIPSIAPTLTSAAPCTPNLSFLSDLTLPDGVEVQPGEPLDKRWQVKNSGDCNWDASYQIKLVAGPAMSAAEQQALYPARGGSEALIRMRFTAPQEPGEYRSAWQAHRPDGQPFGDLIYIVIVVP